MEHHGEDAARCNQQATETKSEAVATGDELEGSHRTARSNYKIYLLFVFHASIKSIRNFIKTNNMLSGKTGIDDFSTLYGGTCVSLRQSIASLCLECKTGMDYEIVGKS